MTKIPFLLLTNTLLSAIRGGFFLLLLFSFCFLCVHLISYLLSKRKPKSPPPEPEKEKAPTVTQSEPVYYIVERKQKRSKAQYGEPKEIKFK